MGVPDGVIDNGAMDFLGLMGFMDKYLYLGSVFFMEDIMTTDPWVPKE